MKKWMFSIVVALTAHLALAQDTELEKWTYSGLTAPTPMSLVTSDTGTGSSFGAGVPFLAFNNVAVLQFPGTSVYTGGVSHPSYAGSTSGIYQISVFIAGASFPKTGTGQGRVGWGLRSNANGTEDCGALLQFENGQFSFYVQDQNGARLSPSIFTGTFLGNTVIRMLYNLDNAGNAGSFRLYYTIGASAEVEVLPGQLMLPAGFSLDEFRMDVTANNWISPDSVIIDDLLLEKREVVPLLTYLGKEVSYAANGDNGFISGDTYEPGDVLQITTTNKNMTITSVANVTTSLTADPAAFAITPLTPTTFASVDVGELFTATYRVEVLDGALDGANTFTVINQIGAGADAIVFKDEIK